MTDDDRATTRRLVETLWERLYAGDYDGVGALFAADGHYRDVPAPDEGAFGPVAIAARLRLGLEPIQDHVHHLSHIVVEGTSAVTEHAEEWHWHTGESVTLPFVSVMESRDGQLIRWWDYWDLQTLLGSAPSWWIDHIMNQAVEIGLRDPDDQDG